MSTLARILLLIGLLFGAIACFVFGVPAGGVGFFIAGIILEGLFWTGLFSKK